MTTTPKTVTTNMGTMPLEDYLDMVAWNSGYDSYEEMEAAGLHIDVTKL